MNSGKDALCEVPIDLCQLYKYYRKYIKPTANYSLFDFYYDFPGKLTLKIPWKNLYNDAVVATLDGLYLLVVPGAGKSCSKGSNLKNRVASR